MAGYWNPDLFLTCELTRACDFPIPQNLTYRRENRRQLCYGALDNDDDIVALDKIYPTSTAAYAACAFKGGNDFTQLADRAPGEADSGAIFPAVDIFVIHAPATMASGRKAMAYIAAYMQERYAAGGEWIVVGDFNVGPGYLTASGIPGIGNLIKRSGVATHRSRRSRSGTELDYALTSIAGLTVRAMRYTRWRNLSDHGPILLEWA
jgi:hypothetical protein